MKKNTKKKKAAGFFRSSIKINSNSKPAISLLNSIKKELTKIAVVTDDTGKLYLPSYYELPKKKFYPPQACALTDIITTTLIIDIFTAWVGTKTLDQLWDLIKPYIKWPLLSNNQLEMRFKFHQNDCTLIVTILAENKKELSENKKLISKAYEYANAWVENKGFTHKYVIYKISNGQVSTIPILRDSI